MLQMTDVACGYGETEVLRGVTVSVREGQITVLIGPNGAGKSTVLKTIFGLVPVRRGEIHYLGQSITGSKSVDNLRRHISYLPQGRCNFPMLTVEENLEMAAYTRRDSGVKDSIESLLTRYPILREKRRQPASYLSGGQQQLMEMAMALLLQPKLLLVDEPSIGLSPAMVTQVFSDLKEIQASGCTILMVEQNVKSALTIADWVAVLELGRVRLEGTPTDVMANPELKNLYLGGSMTREV